MENKHVHSRVATQKVFWPLLLVLLVLTGCTTTAAQASVYVNFDDLQPLPTPNPDKVRPLRVAIAAVISPQGSATSYAPLLDYLSEKLNRPVEAVQRRTYAEVNELIRTGEVDLAFVCTSSYLIGKDDFGMQLLVAPQVHGEKVYRAQIIVPADSPAQNFADLEGKVFAFTDPLSFTGRMYPLYLIQEAGKTAESFFSRTFFTYSHDDAINAVANGVAEGASVDSLVLDFAMKRDPTLADKIRVIGTSPAFGMPPVVVGPQIRPQLFAQLHEILMNMADDPAGQAALQTLDYDRFVEISDNDYRSARLVENAIASLIEVSP